MQAWSNSESVELTCLKKWQETADTVSVELGSRHEDMVFDFKPGQFITLGINMPEKLDYRAYSISSLAGQPRLKLTVKRVNQGLMSNYIVDHLDEGDQVSALKPAGAFNCIDCPPTATKKVTLISAGCGITPVMAMAQHWLENEKDVDIDFIHTANNRLETIYFHELKELDRQHSNFNFKLLLNDSKGTDYPQGYLDKSWLERLAPGIVSSTVYLCGPVGFMEDIESYLKEMNFDMSQFFQESFTPSEKDSNNAVEGSQGDVVKIMVPSFGVEVEAESDSTLIDALEKGGVPVIAACRSGICGSCKCKVTKGSITSSSTETLTPEEIEQGFVLACSSKVSGDVEIALS
ncbi:hybrid-cluster NAD(P)-dependent oxidoreductase [Vibrio sp. ZSDE26]|uniref:Hybrid-cluster NAD(P)-dependent oxidoreductase n=1 Tax=Vibrio amylolyticus TaxID=2847292 RepID=A0A9X2BI30_9VIBR|nr:hybrid-cluster NAD(P)-dependent oxidoreductase [Vibrio amylolyticus]MCK6264561.1 hybrid-cluster NAD(P)-dependent oxidoreductase [Vibrio amylolyticus]